MRTGIPLIAFALLLTTAPAVRAASVDGATIHWTSSGSSAQTVFFVHGWTCDGSSWREQVLGSVPVVG